MVKRISYSPALGQLKVSRPGYNVDTATQEQLAFESLGDPYAGVFMSGESAVNDGTWSTVTVYSNMWGAVAYNRIVKVINLGKTFATPPQVIWSLRDIANPTTGDYAKYSYVHLQMTGAGNNVLKGVAAWASCSTTQLTLRVDYPASYLGNLSWRFGYMVFQT